MFVSLTNRAVATRYVHDIDHRSVTITSQETRRINLNAEMVKYLARAALNPREMQRMLIEGEDDESKEIIASITSFRPDAADAKQPEAAAVAEGEVMERPRVIAAPTISPIDTPATVRAARTRAAAKAHAEPRPQPETEERVFPAPTKTVRSAVAKLLSDMPKIEFAQFNARARRLIGRKWPGGSPSKPVIVKLLQAME